jgi:hypothetical protein
MENIVEHVGQKVYMAASLHFRYVKGKSEK